MDRVIRLTEVQQITGISRASIWRLEKKGLFPSRRRLSGRAIGWSEKDVQRWLATLPSVHVNQVRNK